MTDPGAEFLARILDDAPQPVWVVDEDGLIVFANPAAVAALGYDDAGELRGRPSHATVHYLRPDGSPFPAEDCPMLTPRETGEAVQGEDEWFIRRDGSLFPIAWWSAPIAMARGNGAVLAFTDITERRAGEQAIRERDAAEIRAAESRAAQRRIVESSAAVRRQIVRDLHDGAQQRLVTILMGLQLAREQIAEDPTGATAFLDDAVDQAQAAIDELRELAAGVHPPVLAHHGLIAAVEALAARAALPVSVGGSLPRRLPEAVETNAYFFVAEALTNAVKHAHASRAAVSLELDDAQLSVEVRDDGVGGARDGRTGSGLAGLADRVGALGGRMLLDSDTGQGTTLRAEIPTGRPWGYPMGRRPRRHDTARVPLTVVVVDDDAGFRRVVRRLLQRRGLVVVAEAGDGATAIAAVRHHRPDGVLLDVNLPDRDGLSVTRDVAGRPGAPAVVLTSTDATGFPGAALTACGARAFVAKDRLVSADLVRLFSPSGT